jgi:hypothetical protein
MLLLTPTESLPISVTPISVAVFPDQGVVLASVSPNATVYTAYADNNPRTAGLPTIPGAKAQTITDSRNYTLMDAPGTDVNRSVTFMKITNDDEDHPLAVSISYTNAAGTTIELHSVTLDPLESLQYGFATGFQILDENGLIRTASDGGDESATAIEEVQQEIEQDQEPILRAVVAELRLVTHILCQQNNISTDDMDALRKELDIVGIGIPVH